MSKNEASPESAIERSNRIRLELLHNNREITQQNYSAQTKREQMRDYLNLFGRTAIVENKTLLLNNENCESILREVINNKKKRAGRNKDLPLDFTLNEREQLLGGFRTLVTNYFTTAENRQQELLGFIDHALANTRSAIKDADLRQKSRPKSESVEMQVEPQVTRNSTSNSVSSSGSSSISSSSSSSLRSSRSSMSEALKDAIDGIKPLKPRVDIPRANSEPPQSMTRSSTSGTVVIHPDPTDSDMQHSESVGGTTYDMPRQQQTVIRHNTTIKSRSESVSANPLESMTDRELVWRILELQNDRNGDFNNESITKQQNAIETERFRRCDGKFMLYKSAKDGFSTEFAKFLNQDPATAARLTEESMTKGKIDKNSFSSDEILVHLPMREFDKIAKIGQELEKRAQERESQFGVVKQTFKDCIDWFINVMNNLAGNSSGIKNEQLRAVVREIKEAQFAANKELQQAKVLIHTKADAKQQTNKSRVQSQVTKNSNAL